MDVSMGTSPIVNRSAVAGFVRRWDIAWAYMRPLVASTLVDQKHKPMSTRKIRITQYKQCLGERKLGQQAASIAHIFIIFPRFLCGRQIFGRSRTLIGILRHNSLTEFIDLYTINEMNYVNITRRTRREHCLGWVDAIPRHRASIPLILLIFIDMYLCRNVHRGDRYSVE
jgi:hypothetical protein